MVCEDLPVVVYSPGGLFTDEEKTELEDKMVNPYFDYKNENELIFVSMLIEKYDPVPAHGYKYKVQVLGIPQLDEGFLFGQSDPLEWWVPECLGGCNFSDEFSEMYPEIVDLAE